MVLAASISPAASTMTSNPSSSPGSTKSRDGGFNTAHFDRRTTSRTLSNPTSFGSDETGETSKSGSQQNSLTYATTYELSADGSNPNNATPEYLKTKDGRGGHRSHKSKGGGAFLLSNAAFESANTENTPGSVVEVENAPRQRHILHKSMGKAAGKLPEQSYAQKRMSDGGGGTPGSPLATNVTNADPGNNSNNRADKIEATDHALGTKSMATSFNVDSSQIVNLALNLSESRRNASRRYAMAPLPAINRSLMESTAGGSLRQHLQAQRRVSRNISPRGFRGDRTSTGTPRIPTGQKLNSPIKVAFDTQDGNHYEYHFSESTLARAEKAKSQIELMAQYRRLLQYVPPLKPQNPPRPATAGPPESVPGSPTGSKFPLRPFSDGGASGWQLGRPYNPLQYIRNRKVRARTARAIDGEAQEFGDVAKVSAWVDRVAEEASRDAYLAADCSILPRFSQAAEEEASPYTSPQSGSSMGKSQSAPFKVRRPRVDWITNPADMLADVFWLEQDGNKKLIEDRDGHKIFPPSVDLKRPISREAEPVELPAPEYSAASDLDLRIDTQLPEFKSVKTDSGAFSDSPALKARNKFREVRDATRRRHIRHGSSRGTIFRSRSRSESESSESDARSTRRRRSGRADSTDPGKDILEKQMQEILVKEARESYYSSGTPESQGQRILDSIERSKPGLKEDLDRARNISRGHRRSESLMAGQPNRNSAPIGGSSGRASLEVPGVGPRMSLEGLDSTAPNSPIALASKIKNAFIPSIGMDLSYSRSRHNSRHSSPARRPLSRVRSKMEALHERSASNVRNLSRSRYTDEEMPMPLSQVPSSVDNERVSDSRSVSPSKNPLEPQITEDGSRPMRKSVSGSIKRSREEESGIRGLFKSARNPVSRVSDLLWKSRSSTSSPAAVSASGFSTDESDIEDIRRPKGKIGAGEGSKGLEEQGLESSYSREQQKWKENEGEGGVPPFISEAPIFTSPFEGRRGRTTRARGDGEEKMDVDDVRREREERRRKSRGQAGLLNPYPTPRIDVQSASPSSSPERGEYRDANGRSPRDSSVSSREECLDNRSDSGLGISTQRRRNALPVTGLSRLDASQPRRPSLNGRRQWSITDRGVSAQRGPMTKREIARVRALLLSSGIKANEITRRANELADLRCTEIPAYAGIAAFSQEPLKAVPRTQEHRLAARILSDDVQASSRAWSESADEFVNATMFEIAKRIEILQNRLSVEGLGGLMGRARGAADEVDEMEAEVTQRRTLEVKGVMDRMERMLRRRRRKLRWVRRGGWVVVEWVLVGVMWWVWFCVVIARVVLGVIGGVLRLARWLLWL